MEDGSTARTDRRRDVVLLAVVLLLAAGLRLFKLEERVLWFDEAVSALIAESTLPEAVAAASDEGLPPLYNVVLHLWHGLRGNEAWLRLLSVAAGTATVLVVYVLGATLAGRSAGLLGAALLAISPLHVWYSQEIRVYALQTLLVCLSGLFMVHSLERGKWWRWGLYVLTTGLSLYAQYSSFLFLCAQNLYVLLLLRKHKERLMQWAFSQAAVIVLFYPWLRTLYTHLHSSSAQSWLPPMRPGDPLHFFSLLSGSVVTHPGAWRLFASISALLLVGAACVLLRKRSERRHYAALLAMWFLVPFVLLIILSLKKNIFVARAVLYVVPPFCLLIGWGASRARAPTARYAAGSALGLLVILNLNALWRYYSPENWWIKSAVREVCAKVGNKLQDGDIVVHSSKFSHRPFQYYLKGRLAQGAIIKTADTPRLFQAIGDYEFPKHTEHFKRIWLVVQRDFQYPGVDQRVGGWMDRHHRPLRTIHDSSSPKVYLYEKVHPELAPSLGDMGHHAP